MTNQPEFIKRLYDKVSTIENTKTNKQIQEYESVIKNLQTQLSINIKKSFSKQLSKLIEMDVLTADEAKQIAKNYDIPTSITDNEGITKPKATGRSVDADPCSRGSSRIGSGC